MAEDVHLRARLSLTQNVDEAVRVASQSLTKHASDVEKAQHRIARIITKGDPLRAIEVQARREIAEIERLAERDVNLREQAERAKQAVIERATRRRLQILEREDREVARKTIGLRDRFGRIEQPLNDLRGLMDGLGIATSSTAGALAQLGTDAIASFSSGGGFALAAAAAAGSIYAIVQAVQSARAETRQLIALGQEFGVTAEDVDRVAAAFRGVGADIDRAVVQEVIAAGREAGLTTDEIATMGDEIQRAADLTGGEFAAAAREAFGDAKNLIRQAREELEKYNDERARSGQNTQLAVAAGGMAAAASRREEIQQELFLVEQEIAARTRQIEELEAQLALVGTGREEAGARQLVLGQLEEPRRRLSGLVAQQSALNNQLQQTREEERLLREEREKAVANQRLEETHERLERLRRERAQRERQRDTHSGPAFGARIAADREAALRDEALLAKAGQEAEQEAVELARAARERLAAMMAQDDPLAQLNLQLERELEQIAEKIRRAEDLLSDPAAREQAQAAIDALRQQEDAARSAYIDGRARIEMQRTREYIKRTNEEIARASREAELEQQASVAAAQAGISAAASFAQSFRSFLESEDPADLFRGLLQAAGAVLNLIPGAGPIVGSIVSMIGGMFERGGVPYAFHLPQGRNGLAVLPGLNFDAKPAWLHKNEVVVPERVVNEDLGGLPQAAALAAGRGLPASASGAPVHVHNHIRALDAVDAIGGIRRVMGDAFGSLAELRQSAWMFDSLDRPAPRYG